MRLRSIWVGGALLTGACEPAGADTPAQAGSGELGEDTSAGGGTDGSTDGSAGEPGPGDADPTRNQYLLTSRDEEIVRIGADGSGFTVLFSFDEYVDVETLRVLDDRLYVGAGDNSFNAIELASGTFLWDVPLQIYEVSALSEPNFTIADGVAHAVGAQGVVNAIDLAGGSVRWIYPMAPSGETDGYYSSVGTPNVAGDRVFVGTHSTLDANDLHAIDRTTGERLWRHAFDTGPDQVPQGISGGLRQVDDLLLVPAGDLLALDAATGEPRWRFAMEPLSRGAGTPVVVGDRIYVQGAADVAEGRLYCLALATGEPIWELEAGNDYAGAYVPSVIEGRVYGVYERGGSEWPVGNGRPFVADAATGEIVWQSDDISVSSSPVVANGRVFFHGQNFAGTGSIDDDVGLLAIAAHDGAFVWLDNSTRYASSVTPVVVTDDGVIGAGRSAP